MNHGKIVSFLWGVADLIRDTFKRGKYQDVILPLTVLRRLDCVLAATKEKVLAKQAVLRGRGLQDMDAQLRMASRYARLLTSFCFERCLYRLGQSSAKDRFVLRGAMLLRVWSQQA